MARSTKDSWLNGPGDLKEAVVENVPVKGETVKVRALPAVYSDQALSDASETVVTGRDQIQRYNIGKLRVLQFAHGCIDPQFTVEEAEQVAAKYGPAFDRVVEKVQELSNINEEEIAKVEARFPSGDGGEAAGSENGVAGGGGESPVHLRAGAGTGNEPG